MRHRIKTCGFESDQLFSIDQMLNIKIFVFEPVPDGSVINAQQFRSMCKTDRCAVKLNADCFLLIPSLLHSRFPLAIFRTVIPIVIDSLNRIAWRCFAHIREKFFKAIKPLITDCDSTSSVAMEMSSFWVTASIFHAAPYAISTASRLAVASASRTCYLCFQATATTAMVAFTLTSQITSTNRSDGSAFALTDPVNPASFFGRVIMWFRISMQYCPSIVFVPC